MLQIKTESVELFGLTLLLSERTARDVNKLISFAKSKEKTLSEVLIEASICLADGLKINYRDLKWYRYFTKRKLMRLLSHNSLLTNLAPSQIFSLAERIYRLEGIVAGDGKKKIQTEANE